MASASEMRRPVQANKPEKFQATGVIEAIRIRGLCGPTESEFARSTPSNPPL